MGGNGRLVACMKFVRLMTCIVPLIDFATSQADAQNEQRVRTSDTPRCYGIIAVVGSEAITEAAALIAAQRAWRARVRFDYGERYIGLDNAENINSVCTRSSTSETAVGKEGEFFTGQERNRCKIWARPCRVEDRNLESDPDNSPSP